MLRCPQSGPDRPFWCRAGTGWAHAGHTLPGRMRGLETVVLVPNSVIPLPLCTGPIAGLPCPSSHPEAQRLGQAGRASQRKTQV